MRKKKKRSNLNRNLVRQLELAGIGLGTDTFDSTAVISTVVVFVIVKSIIICEPFAQIVLAAIHQHRIVRIPVIKIGF